MNEAWKFYLLLIAICLVIQGFFAMLEMACVSFNKVRLQYYVSKGNKRAKWLTYLLNHPALLFGTTLIGVNTTLLIGSESARRFYDSLGLSPDLAPLSQVIIVLIVAEIAPLFAGRRHAEQVVMFGIPIVYACCIVLRPVIWFLDIICRAFNRLMGTPVEAGAYLTREELQNLLEEREEPLTSQPEGKELSTISANIFALKTKTAKELMKPLKETQVVSSHYTVAEMRNLLSETYTPFVPIYHKTPQNIVAIAYPRDLLRLADNRRIREFARPPWFIVQTSSILEILKQFRRNNQSVAVVLNETGLAVGILTLDEIIDEIFNESDEWMAFGDVAPQMYHIALDKTFPGDMKLADFNREFSANLHYEDAETLEELVTKALGHPPVEGEVVRIDQFELTVEEASLLGAKMISVRTVY